MDASTLPDTVEEMKQVLGETCVFGRVKPEQKQLIIKAFQENGHVVGMVGDGVNDVLAIKDADVVLRWPMAQMRLSKQHILYY